MPPRAGLIYDLHPLLAGPLQAWPAHLDRIAAMKFDTVHAPGLGMPGASGSIHAVADPFALHPSLRGADETRAQTLLERLLQEAQRRRLNLSTDLQVARVAAQARIVTEHPEWFSMTEGGPVPAEGQVGGQYRTLHDRTAPDFGNPNHAERMAEYFAGVALHYARLGFTQLRCPAAHEVPAALWRDIIQRVRAERPEVRFMIASLGAPFESLLALAGAGFDDVMDSARWWDFRESWFLPQQERLREVSAPASFAEEPFGQRLAEGYDLGDPERLSRLYRSRYMLAAVTGTALIMPMGFEHGLRRRLDPIHATPEDWRADLVAPPFDLSDEIAAINTAKAATPALTRNTPLVKVSAPNAALAALMRLDRASAASAGSGALLIANPDLWESREQEVGTLLTPTGGRLGTFADALAPGGQEADLPVDAPLELEALDARLFTAKAPPAAAKPRLTTPDPANRVAIERVEPELDGGRFPAKRIVGESVEVTADIVCDGHDVIAAQVLFKEKGEDQWRTTPMALVDNDRWGGRFTVTRNAHYVFTLEAWKDPFASWRYEITKKHDAGVPIALELIEGRHIVERALEEAQARGDVAHTGPLKELLDQLARVQTEDQGGQLALLLAPAITTLMRKAGPRNQVSRYDRELEVTVDRTAAAFAAWYELFPRSMSDDANRHGTFDDVIKKLPYVRSMGFDVLYFPPIHPIGTSNRKGPNNTLTPGPDDPGSPYAIGAPDGGHREIHRELGTFDDFKRLIDAAADHGLELAIDFAIQCSPDHPWIKEHPGWFEWRPDGTIRYAENPPKKYQDIVNVDFYAKDAVPSLWEELRDVVLFWCETGIRIFRVDNPHTKPLPFWEWMIREVQAAYPDAIFLAEAFTKPKMMKRLAKLGFTQSYSYFTWRNTKAELTEYLTELTRQDPKDYMRVNFFVNTPDINPVPLQTSGRPLYRVRALLASTLSTVWGLYSGFELTEGTPLPGREEYLDSEKYQIRVWDWDRPGHIREDVALFNRVRRENPALWQFRNLTFLPSSSDQVLIYAKTTPALDNIIIVAANLDPQNAQGSWFEVPFWRWNLPDDTAVIVEDLATGRRFDWHGKSQHVWLDPNDNPYAIWRIVLPGLPS